MELAFLQDHLEHLGLIVENSKMQDIIFLLVCRIHQYFMGRQLDFHPNEVSADYCIEQSPLLLVDLLLRQLGIFTWVPLA